MKTSMALAGAIAGARRKEINNKDDEPSIAAFRRDYCLVIGKQTAKNNGSSSNRVGQSYLTTPSG